MESATKSRNKTLGCLTWWARPRRGEEEDSNPNEGEGSNWVGAESDKEREGGVGSGPECGLALEALGRRVGKVALTSVGL